MNKFLITLFILVGLLNILASWTRSILSNNDYPVNNSSPFRDIKNIFKLANSTTDKKHRIKYLILGCTEAGLTTILVILFFVYVITSITGIRSSACKEFIGKEYNFVVISKYLDEKEHSYSTLIVQDKQGHQMKNQDLVFDESGLFDYLHIGDTLMKKKGEPYVKVTSPNLDTIFKVDLGCR